MGSRLAAGKRRHRRHLGCSVWLAAGDGLAQYSLVSGGMGRVDQAYVEFGTEVGVDDAGDEIVGEVAYSHAHEGEGDGGVWELDREEVRGGGG